MAKSSKSRKKKGVGKRQFFILLSVLCILGGGYYLLKKYTKDADLQKSRSDKTSQYILLENNDSIKYLAVVIYRGNVSINNVATTFYKNEIFWPYIYIENKGMIVNPLNISKEVVLKIPRLSPNILDVNDAASIKIIKNLADSILENVTDPI